MDNLIVALLDESLNRAINEYGLEGTEEVINNVYTYNPEIKKALLNRLKERLNK